MLSNQTRREVRGPFAISLIQEKVEGAKEKYEKLLPEVEKKHERLCVRFATAMDRAKGLKEGSKRYEEYLKVLKAFEDLRSGLMNGFRGHYQKSYDT